MRRGIFALSVFLVPFARADVPVFCGFEDVHYQMYDAEIAQIVRDFNAHRGKWVGGTMQQAQGIPDLTEAQVKAHMLQESGGGDLKSRIAWRYDPLQINIPGDWSEYKRYLGLRKPRRANDGSAKVNLRAGVMFLSRKGFGVSGQPAENRASATFDGWETALRRYNGRTDRVSDGMTYREAYAGRILDRARDPSSKVPISIKK